jgi:hypothetical protein
MVRIDKWKIEKERLIPLRLGLDEGDGLVGDVAVDLASRASRSMRGVGARKPPYMPRSP